MLAEIGQYGQTHQPQEYVKSRITASFANKIYSITLSVTARSTVRLIEWHTF